MLVLEEARRDNSLSRWFLKPAAPFERRQQNPHSMAEKDSMSLHSYPQLFLTPRTEAQAEAEIQKGCGGPPSLLMERKPPSSHGSQDAASLAK